MDIKFKTMNGFVDGEKFIKAILKTMGSAINPLNARIAALEAKQKQLPYQGVYQRSNTYERGTFVTFKGSMWYCCADTTRQQPGSSADWLLAVKGSE